MRESELQDAQQPESWRSAPAQDARCAVTAGAGAALSAERGSAAAVRGAACAVANPAAIAVARGESGRARAAALGQVSDNFVRQDLTRKGTYRKRARPKDDKKRRVGRRLDSSIRSKSLVCGIFPRQSGCTSRRVRTIERERESSSTHSRVGGVLSGTPLDIVTKQRSGTSRETFNARVLCSKRDQYISRRCRWGLPPARTVARDVRFVLWNYGTFPVPDSVTIVSFQRSLESTCPVALQHTLDRPKPDTLSPTFFSSKINRQTLRRGVPAARRRPQAGGERRQTPQARRRRRRRRRGRGRARARDRGAET